MAEHHLVAATVLPSPAETLLIDDLQVNVDAWITESGAGYLFRDDDTFAQDVLAGHLPVFTSHDLVTTPIT